MAQLFTLGGDRLGSGKDQKIALHNYEMNSFNLEQDFKSSMAPGILYPFIKMVGTNHGTFDIDLDTFVRTLPTQGPLFGSFKLQVDLFSVPMRLYQGVLHNNPIDIGLNMDQVYLPKLLFETIDGKTAPTVKGSNFYNRQVNNSALLKYLGISGAGTNAAYAQNNSTVKRKFNAIPILAYYDIFKCYYSNKQEENAYVIVPGTPEQEDVQISYTKATYINMAGPELSADIPTQIFKYDTASLENIFYKWYIKTPEKDAQKLTLLIKNSDGSTTIWSGTLYDFEQDYHNTVSYDNARGWWVISLENAETKEGFYDDYLDGQDGANMQIIGSTISQYTADIKLQPFKLKNIDKMRYALLKENEIGSEFIIGDQGNWDVNSGEDETGLPYSALFKKTTEGITWNAFTQNGLMVKTYQSDLFNNWLDTAYIDGPNGIAAITAIDTTQGSFTMDTLNLAEKFYELLNRIIVAGGTYQDWQEAVYGEGAVRMCETPMYIGGMSAEIMFEEVIATTENGEADQALGSLGGKGMQVNKKGGNNIHVKMDEPGYIIGIASITPRICYSQGTDWDMVELDTLDDLHKPQLDGIGFQPLMVEQFAWWNTTIAPNTATILFRGSAGKQTAWINYQTAVDKCFGDFADQDGYSFMVLNRNYEVAENAPSSVKDITTYIDPAKFNYAFAYTELAAQNFWVQIHSKVIARRKMGAQQLPNL